MTSFASDHDRELFDIVVKLLTAQGVPLRRARSIGHLVPAVHRLAATLPPGQEPGARVRQAWATASLVLGVPAPD
jgi:hypothetical protein